MFDINGAEFIVLAVIILIVVGPERLPEYAAKLGQLVRDIRRFAMGAREQVRAELGPEFDDVDWSKLDPRQYDPRRIVRDALQEAWDEDPTPAKPSLSKSSKPELSKAELSKTKAVTPGGPRPQPGTPAPFDTEAT